MREVGDVASCAARADVQSAEQELVRYATGVGDAVRGRCDRPRGSDSVQAAREGEGGGLRLEWAATAKAATTSRVQGGCCSRQ